MDFVWDMDYRSHDTAEMPVFTEPQAEMWDLDSEADDTPMPEKFTTYQEIQSEDWDVDDEVQEVPTIHASCMEFLTDPKGIGASPYVMNCNVTIDTQDVSLGRDVAAAIRESSPGGIPGVQVIALPHEGTVEIACNVESVPGSVAGAESWPAFRVGDQTFCHAPASLITTRVAELTGRQGVRTRGMALVGFTPLECKRLAETALSQDIGHFWKELHGVRM
ncbi:hypothetical protein KOW79_005481 [Hemibagrus wyckioides]|uniref:Uncharacterized protein n=1 Tax=Hemibagrus wyckioides TaxID=337641 RepID=A0A9D3NZL4_9TELE|nr:hypothetical protein KOW79_005481 [Hemibagrus wyckioides]